MRRRWLIPVPLAAAAGLVGWWMLPDDSPAPDPIEAAEATYSYSTSGFEEVDALAGERHAYPATTTLTVLQSDCGRLLLWRPLPDRSTGYELCEGRLRAIHEVHQFFGRRDERTYECEAGSSLRRGWRCTFEDTTEVARGGELGVERVDGVDAVHIRLTTRISGGTKGTGTRDFWLRPDDIPVRMAATNENSTGSVIGRVNYRERYELELRPAQP